jgi:hypothetical protein
MKVVNTFSRAMSLPDQPTVWQGINKNMSEQDARDLGRNIAHTGAADIALAGQLIQWNGRKSIYGCVSSPCNQSEVGGEFGVVKSWKTDEANAVDGASAGMQFAPTYSAAEEGGSHEVLVRQLFRKLPVTNRRSTVGGAGERMVVKDISLLKFTYAPKLWQKNAAHFQTQQGMLNESHVYQRAHIRVTRPGFLGFEPSLPTELDDTPGTVTPITAEFTNPGFFAATTAFDGSNWADESYFGIEPQTGKTFSTHNRLQISLEAQPTNMTACPDDDSPCSVKLFNPKMKPCYIPVVADDAAGSVSDHDASLFKSQMALAAHTTYYAELGGCGLAICLLVAAFAIMAFGPRPAQSQGASEPLLGDASPNLLPIADPACSRQTNV